MSVERGGDWGELADKPSDLVYFDSDRSAARAISLARRANRPLPAIGLTGGDLYRTLGGRKGSTLSQVGEATRVTVDVGVVLVDGKIHWFLAHLVARHWWLRGRVVVVANAAFLRSWNVAPRAHPGDGWLDLLDADPPMGDRLKAWQRLPSGTHVPHPDIASSRTKAAQLEFARPIPIRIDGHRVGTATTLSVRLEPDAVDIWI